MAAGATNNHSGLQWAEVLCCSCCSKVFDFDAHPPVNLPCGHAACRPCLAQLRNPECSLDQTPLTVAVEKLPVNRCLLKILKYDKRLQCSKSGQKLTENERQLVLEVLSGSEEERQHYAACCTALLRLTAYLHRAESETGGSVWSPDLSRSMQRKLVSLICFQLLEPEGRIKACKVVRAMGERAISELLMFHQNATHLSSNLWSAVRARGCQFLGPAMQEETLRLILLALSEGALIARKTLVMYIVQMLSDDYPQASKTCVGHVVQLLYRASSFHVIKRDGESSLMQLKPEFRTYDSLRREHDAQIVQIAMEAGLRISPDQWSSLLYGDQSHRSHMQSIIDKSPFGFSQNIHELQLTLQRNGDTENLRELIPDFELLASVGSGTDTSVNCAAVTVNGTDNAPVDCGAQEVSSEHTLDSPPEPVSAHDETAGRETSNTPPPPQSQATEVGGVAHAAAKSPPVSEWPLLAASLGALVNVIDGQVAFAQKRSQMMAQLHHHNRQHRYQQHEQHHISHQTPTPGGGQSPNEFWRPTPSPNRLSASPTAATALCFTPSSHGSPSPVVTPHMLPPPPSNHVYITTQYQPIQPPYAVTPPPAYFLFKTKLCREVASGRVCPRGERCTYAHSQEEMMIHRRRDVTMGEGNQNSCAVQRSVSDYDACSNSHVALNADCRAGSAANRAIDDGMMVAHMAYQNYPPAISTHHHTAPINSPPVFLGYNQAGQSLTLIPPGYQTVYSSGATVMLAAQSPTPGEPPHHACQMVYHHQAANPCQQRHHSAIYQNGGPKHSSLSPYYYTAPQQSTPPNNGRSVEESVLGDTTTNTQETSFDSTTKDMELLSVSEY